MCPSSCVVVPVVLTPAGRPVSVDRDADQCHHAEQRHIKVVKPNHRASKIIRGLLHIGYCGGYCMVIGGIFYTGVIAVLWPKSFFIA